eukprot:1201060-Rhodomonas_salina.1
MGGRGYGDSSADFGIWRREGSGDRGRYLEGGGGAEGKGAGGCRTLCQYRTSSIVGGISVPHHAPEPASIPEIELQREGVECDVSTANRVAGA